MKIEGQVRIPSGCAIAAVISREGNKMSGEKITDAMRPMHDRSNGLGGGFAGYGIYPEYKDFYALHMFFDERDYAKKLRSIFKGTLRNRPVGNYSNPQNSGDHRRTDYLEIFCRSVEIRSRSQHSWMKKNL